MDTWILKDKDTYAPYMGLNASKSRSYNGCFKNFRRSLTPFFKSSKTAAEYTELSGVCCKKLLLPRNGRHNRVILFAEESWAQSAASSYWIITPSYWRRNVCHIEEVSGYRKFKGKGEIVSCNNGSLLIAGTFNKKDDVPDFQLFLSTNVGQTDFNMGYCLTGTLERGWAALNKFETTHFAVVKKHWPDSSFSAKAGFKLL